MNRVEKSHAVSGLVKKTGLPLSMFLPLLIAVPGIALTEETVVATEIQTTTDSRQAIRLDAVKVIAGQDDDLLQVIGAANRIDQQQMEQEEHDDLHRVLASVPGVNIRGEDGYGLRPNIGLRGTTTERSQKINILEDGVLITPAPYSAPAAYYVPMMSRLTGIEVVKGPAAITHGPNTVGGTINLITREIPHEQSGELDVAAGSNDYRKAHAFYGASQEQFGYLLEGIRVDTDGFKELDGGGDTGFEKNNAMLKLRYNTPLDAAVYQQWDLKLNYADEASDETYLGLSDEDFAANPYRRYAASQNALMDWQHKQVNLSYLADFENGLTLRSTLYQHGFDRAWAKLNNFSGNAPSLLEVLSNPNDGLNQNLMQVLRGEEDSLGPDQDLIIGTNDRSFISQGWQNEMDWLWKQGELEHQFKVGFRYHEDEIERNHSEERFSMIDGKLVADGNGDIPTVQNKESAQSIAVFLQDEMHIGRWQIRAGIRTEYIDYESFDKTSATVMKSDDSVWLPALGVFYELSPESGIFAGVHKGFVPTGPGQASSIEPEKSVNYEAGYRHASELGQLDVVGFFSDYSNLKGVCTFSSGCTLANGEAFNAGEVDIFGLELQAGRILSTQQGWRFPLQFTYTLTKTEFKTAFDSDFALWEQVQEGDQLPYMAEHRFAFTAGVETERWDLAATLSYVGEQLEQAGQKGVDDRDAPLSGKHVPSYTVTDIVGRYRLDSSQLLYAKVDNVLDEEYLISRRPYGARPGKPREFQLGYKLSF